MKESELRKLIGSAKLREIKNFIKKAKAQQVSAEELRRAIQKKFARHLKIVDMAIITRTIHGTR